MKNERKKRYSVFAFRLNDGTYKKLKQKKVESGLSWNLFIYNLIKDL